MEWLFERKGEKIMRRTPFARATASIGRVSDMTSVMKVRPARRTGLNEILSHCSSAVIPHL